MNPVTRSERYLANAAGESGGSLPAPVTREEYYLQKICNRLDRMAEASGGVSDEALQTAVDHYLEENGVSVTVADSVKAANGNSTYRMRLVMVNDKPALTFEEN